MTQLTTQLLIVGSDHFADNSNVNNAYVEIHKNGQVYTVTFYDNSHNVTYTHEFSQSDIVSSTITIPNPVSGNDTFQIGPRIYTFADGQPNRFQTATIANGTYPQERNADISSGTFGVDANNEVFEYSKLTKVLGTGGITATTDPENPGVVTIDGSSITPDFNDVALTGNTTAENLAVGTTQNPGSLDVTGTADVSGQLTAGSASLGDTDITGILTIPGSNFRPTIATYNGQEAVPSDQLFPGNRFFINVT